MEIVFILLSLVGGVILGFWMQSVIYRNKQKLEIQRVASEYDLEKEKLKAELLIEKNKFETFIEVEKKNIEKQQHEAEELKKSLRVEFENLANKIFEDKSNSFTKLNKESLSVLLNPLKENIETFKKKVEETYDKESKMRFSLEEKIKELVTQTDKVSQEANNLASALKGDSKKQGDWGETILESILEASGLRKNGEFFIQQTIKDDEGNNLRPDVLVKLPDERVIIIDSKVSLRAYERFYNTESDEERKSHLKDLLAAIYAHINTLQNKKYDNLSSSLDFVMMFIPIEPAYLLAIQNDDNLWSYAYSKRILLISPTNLIACLKIIEDLWKRDLQTKQVKAIVERGELMYEKFVIFTETIEDLGKKIDAVQRTYDEGRKQLSEGRGNLIGQAQKLKSLGLKSSKELPPAMIIEDEDDNLNEV